MKGNFFNKCLDIGPGGIKCPCCVEYNKRDTKKKYRRKRRKVEKEFFQKIIIEEINNR